MDKVLELVVAHKTKFPSCDHCPSNLRTLCGPDEPRLCVQVMKVYTSLMAAPTLEKAYDTMDAARSKILKGMGS